MWNVKPRKGSCFICFVLAVFLIFLMQGCSSTVRVDEKGRSIIRSFGYVRIVLPPKYQAENSNGEPIEYSSFGVKTLGFQIGENSASIGYSAFSLLQIPLDCRLFAIVQNERQLDHLIGTLDNMKGENLCATVSSD